jgi:acyl carrier protein
MSQVRSNVKAQIRAFINDNFIIGANGGDFADSDSFLEHHIIDSTGFLELVTHIEETYGFPVKDEDMVPENLDSLDAIEAYVARQP